jgi:hypothetical protein
MKILMLAVYLIVMFGIWMFLRWYIPTYGFLGFAIWIVVCFGCVLLLDRRWDSSAEQ